MSLIFLGPLAWGQQRPDVPEISQESGKLLIADFSGGLNTYRNPLLIKENEAQVARNVLLDKTGSIDRRQGYTRINSTAFGGGITDVNAVYQLEQSNGNRYCVSFSSTNGYYSTDGCQTFTSFVSTLTRNNDVSCDSLQDRLYCVNNQYNFYFQGTASVNVPNAPASLKYLRVHRNRCFGAGASTNLSRLFWSGAVDCTAWATSTDYVDIAPQDGDVITGIGEPFFDMLPIYKKYSTWVLKGASPNTFTLVNISKSVGALNHRSIANFNNLQLFDSVGANGGQPGVYGFDGIVVKEMSKKLRNDIDLIDTFRSVTSIKTIDTKADFDAGVFSSLAMSSSRQAGLMQSSYTTFTDSLGADFSAGTLTNVVTTDAGGSVTLSSDTLKDDFADGDYTNNPTWTVTTGSWQIAAGALTPAEVSTNEIYTASTVSTGTWTFALIQTGTSKIARVYFMCDGSSSASCNGYYVEAEFDSLGTTLGSRLIRTGGTTLCSVSESVASGNVQTYNVTRNQSNEWNLSRNGVSLCTATDSTYKTSKFFIFRVNNSAQSIDNINCYGYKNGNIVSRIFDLAITVPVWGLFQANVSSNAASNVGTTITFEVQASTAGNGSGFESLVSQSLASQIKAKTTRYLRYKATMSTTISTNTPQMNSVTVAAASTGTWLSAETFLSNNILAGGFGLFQTVQTVTGSSATITYSIRTSSYATGTNQAVWTAITPGNTITNSTGAYVQVSSTFSTVVATETASLDTIIFNWNEGAAAKSSTAKVFQNRYHYGAQSLAGSINDTVYVMNENGAWVKWDDVRPRFLNVVNQTFVMADSTTTTNAGFVHHLYNTDSDNGLGFTAAYQTKDFALGEVLAVKSVDEVSIVGGNQPTTISLDLLGNSGLSDKTYSVNLSTGMAYQIKYFNVEPPVNGNTFSLKVSNTDAGAPWTVHALMLEQRGAGLQQP